MSSLLQVKNLIRHHRSSTQVVRAVDDVSFNVEDGSFVAVVGASGSGKSTLLSLLAGLDQADSGEIWFGKEALHRMTEEERAAFRRSKLGFIFQSFQLFDSCTALENVQFPLELLGATAGEAKSKAQSLLQRVGLGDRAEHFPRQLSGGEQQRVAVARAFATQPPFLFADEPTGNLDSQTGQQVMSCFTELQQEQKSTLLMVTHDLNIAKMADRILHMHDGKLREE
ncbi:MAG: hypothetical protein CMK59_04145 [Proteobacteria bacterium]|nr:hypothetical protein [Pseudomonadota bacterium]